MCVCVCVCSRARARPCFLHVLGHTKQKQSKNKINSGKMSERASDRERERERERERDLYIPIRPTVAHFSRFFT